MPPSVVVSLLPGMMVLRFIQVGVSSSTFLPFLWSGRIILGGCTPAMVDTSLSKHPWTCLFKIPLWWNCRVRRGTLSLSACQNSYTQPEKCLTEDAQWVINESTKNQALENRNRAADGGTQGEGSSPGPENVSHRTEEDPVPTMDWPIGEGKIWSGSWKLEGSPEEEHTK